MMLLPIYLHFYEFAPFWRKTHNHQHGIAHMVFYHVLPSVWINTNMLFQFYYACTVKPESPNLAERTTRLSSQLRVPLWFIYIYIFYIVFWFINGTLLYNNNTTINEHSYTCVCWRKFLLYWHMIECASRRCEICGGPKPIRSHHCSTCNRCVEKMDHHCPFTANCVGKGNFKFFYCFVVSRL